MKITGRACVRKRVLATFAGETRASFMHRSGRTQLQEKSNKAMGLELKNTLAQAFTRSTQRFSAGGPDCEQRASITPTLLPTSGSAVENGKTPSTITGEEDNKESAVTCE